MIEHMTLEQLRDFLDPARCMAIIPDSDLGHWVRIRPERVEEAFRAGLAPFSALTRYIGSDPVYEVREGTPFVPSLRPTLVPVMGPRVSVRRSPRPIVVDLSCWQVRWSLIRNREIVTYYNEQGKRSYTHLEKEDRYYMGYKGEFALQNWLEGRRADYNHTVLRQMRSAGVDFKLPINGVRATLDVKAGPVNARYFMSPESKDTSPDYFVGARMMRDERKVELLGWASQAEVLAMPVDNRWKKKTMTRYCEWEKLHDMRELVLTTTNVDRPRFHIIRPNGRSVHILRRRS